jgi:(2Fe-2S) ferredoxin
LLAVEAVDVRGVADTAGAVDLLAAASGAVEAPVWVLPLFAGMAAAIPLLILTFARKAEEKYEQGEILVCEANACRRAGAQALFTEIQEEANGVDECSVQPTGCLGACRQGPCALVVKRDERVLYTFAAFDEDGNNVRSPEKVAAVVRKANGRASKEPPQNATGQTRWKQKLVTKKAEDPVSVDDW